MLGINSGYWLPGKQQPAQFASVGKNVRIHNTAVIVNPMMVSIGDDVRIDAFCVLSAREINIGSHVVIHSGCVLSGAGCIDIGDFCALSHGVKIFTSTDDVDIADHSLAGARTIDKPVVLERHATMCVNVAVMPGVTCGAYCYVGAFSLVRDNVDPMSIFAGVPAKLLRPRKLSVAQFEAFEKRVRGKANA